MSKRQINARVCNLFPTVSSIFDITFTCILKMSPAPSASAKRLYRLYSISITTVPQTRSKNSGKRSMGLGAGDSSFEKIGVTV